ncbi:helicase c2 [Gluconacetobacter johannae DSM 13595]|uniref:DEAD/DEAH box helicase family protein n=1 Tax=Gluconacetobacter johannae TaxID=112140 RepID=A0A7W4J8E2_9PROT|nr:DEAD/DEAH box helicase family protein [Gluconacetobacter johannae]MBB2176596.1 DEAD/DEAH box helicase family protein [Gluconacetobacter johannae]GBQ80210.1 helicase c2 [Gluconacetobacter johannae DSM 13595]
MDFSKLGSAKKAQAPTDPIRIFESLPSLSGTFNDLWRGQDKALTEWHAARDRQDVLVSLNTGAGKTIVGLLIAQSLVNEGLQNVLYVCSTIDLVRQTAEEANRIGIDHSTRVRKGFSNDLFETGKAFCITTYAALFNGHSALRNRFFPQAIIFDDAHVAESLLRDAFTLRVDVYDHEELFKEIAELFKPHFHELGVAGRFRDALDLSRHSTAFVAPHGLYERSERLLEILLRHGIKDHDELTYPFAWLEDRINACAAVFTRGAFELTPPFLPSLALDIFQQKVRRVYLSATLQSQTEFIRAFGRKPDVTVTPSNDAGNGERLIVSGRKVKNGFGPEFAEKLVETQKVVIAVPDYERAKAWAKVAEPPAREDFSELLDAFRKGGEGAFTLVSRVDGIDLPHDTCRIMIMEGLPSGTSLLERYQWEFLRMNNVHAVRVANRLAQLFGRINRGRNDYGAFLIQGDDLDKWLGNDRNLALLPPLLQKQVLIGREVQEAFGIDSHKQAIALIERVLGRDEGWLDYYQREVKLAELDQDQLARHNAAEPFMVAAALSEAKYAAAMWRDDPTSARRELEKTVDTTAQHDTPLGGWHALWLGAAFEREGDKDAARTAYGQAMRRLGNGMTLPWPMRSTSDKAIPEMNAFGRSLQGLLCYSNGNKFEAEVKMIVQALALIDQGHPRQAEAGVRALGELLGFTATRPDNDGDTGPDVLWRDEAKPRQLGFELKTDKNDPATYFKKDISQGHDHLEWMTQTYPDYDIIGLAFVGPAGKAHSRSNPSAVMSLCQPSALAALRDELLALIEDLRKRTPMERLIAISKETEDGRWDIESIFNRLNPTPMLK